MSLCKIKAFFAEHFEAVIGILVTTLFIFLICFCAIPVTETMTVDKCRWSWDIPIYIYTVHDETSWVSPPSDAYDVDKEWEYHYSRTVKTGEWVDSEGRTYDITHTESVYDWHYYYKVNRWDFSYNVSSVGFDRKPYEAECNLPYNISNPKIGDQKRSARKEQYDVYGVIDSKCVCYHVSESDWKKIDVGGTITYSRHRFGDKVWNIRFE